MFRLRATTLFVTVLLAGCLVSCDSDLIISGTVTATPSPATIAGNLDGLVGILKSPRGGWPDFTSVCTGQHRFVLTRQ